jgi:hypothetical protein
MSVRGQGRFQLRLPAGRLEVGRYRLDADIRGAVTTKRLNQEVKITAH